MIKINLIREKKRGARGASPKGSGAIGAGFAVLAAAAAAVFFFVHTPLADKVAAQNAVNAKAKKDNDALASSTKDFDVVNQQVQALVAQEEAIKRLTDARAVPAWFLHELASILTKGHQPTMTPEMNERVKTDPNRQWNIGWDPKRVWITSFKESAGKFTLQGGAQSDIDVTQLALRLQASVFFSSVVPEGVGKVSRSVPGGKGKAQYYTFTVTGRVVY
jgi:type IV pilus assembly protein PilN